MHGRLGCPEECKQARRCCYCEKGQRKRVCHGAGNRWGSFHPSCQHDLRLLRYRYRQIWQFWSFVGPFSAFDVLDEVINIDEVVAPESQSMLIRTRDRGCNNQHRAMCSFASSVCVGGNKTHLGSAMMLYFNARPPWVPRRMQAGPPLLLL